MGYFHGMDWFSWDILGAKANCVSNPCCPPTTCNYIFTLLWRHLPWRKGFKVDKRSVALTSSIFTLSCNYFVTWLVCQLLFILHEFLCLSLNCQVGRNESWWEAHLQHRIDFCWELHEYYLLFDRWEHPQ